MISSKRFISILLVICMMLSIIPISAFASETAEIIPADGWTIMNPVDNYIINSTNSLTINTTEKGDFDYTAGGNVEPKSYWLTDAPSGDFTATVKISGGFNENYQKAGIIVYGDAYNNVSAVRRYHSYLNYNIFGMFQFKKGVGYTETKATDSNKNSDAYIKIVKTGNVFEGFFSYDGNSWTSAGTVTDATTASASDLKIGVYALDGNGPGNTPLAVTFTDFTVNGTVVPFGAIPKVTYVPVANWEVNNATDKYTINNKNSVSVELEKGDFDYTGVSGSIETKNYWLTDAPGGDFTATVKVTGGLTENYQKSGIIVYGDAYNNVSVVRRYHQWLTVNSNTNTFGMYQYHYKSNPAYTETKAEDINKNADAYLKIVKTGNVFEGFFSYDGNSWTSAGTITDANTASASNLKIGFYATDGNGPNNTLSVTFTDFTVNGTVVPFGIDQEKVKVERIDVDTETLILSKDDTANITATAYPQYALDKTIIWSSSDETVAKVVNGKVTAIGDGKAVITAKCGDVQTTIPVVVGMAIYPSDLDWTDTEFVLKNKTGYKSVGLNECIDNDGGIAVGGVTYAKGIAAHASSEIKLNIEKYQAMAFEAYIGINDCQANLGQANFVVKLDDVEVYRKNDVKGSDDKHHVYVDIPEHTKFLTLITEEGTINYNDHTSWADAKIITPENIFETIDTDAVAYVTNLINGLGEVTASSVEAIRTARKAYDKLSDTLKEKVLNYPVLKAAEQKLVELGVVVEERKTPLMGWSSWNCFFTDINESNLIPQIDALVSTGLADAGYEFFNIDDCYQNARDANGNLQYNTSRFPNGIKYIADYAHSKGLKAGIYSDAGSDTCASTSYSQGLGTGLYGYEEQDLRKFFLEWDFDFVKVDWCGGKKLGLDRETQYTKIGNLIDEIQQEKGKDIVYNVCCWEFPGPWITKIADSWRTAEDISYASNRASFSSVLNQIDKACVLAEYQSPGHVNDPDMLIVGLGMTPEEDKSHFAMWCMLSAPLVLGNDLTKMDAKTLSILTNKELIAIDQDPACKMATIAKEEDNVQTWVKELGSENSGEKAVALLNRNDYATTVTLSLKELGFTSDVQVRDLWTHENLDVNDTVTVNLPAHGCAVYKVTGEAEVSDATIKAKVTDDEFDTSDTIDWVNGNDSKADAYVINNVTENSLSLVTTVAKRIAKIYFDADATVTATLDGKQNIEVVPAGKAYTVVYNGELLGPDMGISVSGAKITKATVADYADETVVPDKDVFIVSNEKFKGQIDLTEGTIDAKDYVNDTQNANVLSGYVTGEGAVKADSQTDLGDFYEVILPAAKTPTKANIYYSLDTASVKITVADKAVKVSSIANETNVFTVVYTSEKEIPVRIHLTSVLADSSAISLKAVTLTDQASNFMAMPSLQQDGTVITMTADTALIDSASAYDTLVFEAYDRNGNLVDSDSKAVVIGETITASVTLTSEKLIGKLVATLINANVSYEIALPLDLNYNTEESEFIGNLLAKDLVQNGAVLIDVRSADEYAAGHIDGAINILYTDIFATAEDIITDKNANIVVYCSAGKRSAQAEMMLKTLGYTNVYNLGAMENWDIEPTISIEQPEKEALVKVGDSIKIDYTVNQFEKDITVKYAFGENATLADATDVPENNYIALAGDGYVNAYLLWKDNAIASAKTKINLLNKEIPSYEYAEYLSNIEWTIDQSGWDKNKRDKSIDGNTLTILDNTFDKGIGSHASSTIEAYIPNGMSRFVTVAGCDAEEAPKLGNAIRKIQYAIFIDDVLVEKSLELPYGYYHVFDIEIPDGAQKIRLETYMVDNTYNDHADWAIAGFVAKEQWTFDQATGTLTVNVNLSDFTAKNTPWYENVADITKVVVSEGVTEIGNWAFGYLKNVTEVSLPSTLTSIGRNAFYRNESLTEITIPEGITTIENGTFAYCYALEKVNLPASLALVEKVAFSACKSLETLTYAGENWAEITIKDGNTALTNCYPPIAEVFEWSVVDGVLTISGNVAMEDYASKQAPWYVKADEITAIVIEDGVKSIGKYAFAYLRNVETVEIADSVESIGSYAFYGCYNLTEIDLPDNVKTIGGSAFAYCAELKKITIPASVTKLNKYTFTGNRSLRTGIYEGNFEDLEILVGNDYFVNANRVEIPESKVDVLGELTVPVAGENYTLETAYAFYATETFEDVNANSDYKYYHADFVVSFDKDITDVALAGYYREYAAAVGSKDWVPMLVENKKAGEESRLLKEYWFGEEGSISYQELCTLDKFLCGAMDVNDNDTGAKMTVELRLYEVTENAPSTSVETGEYVTIGSYTYTF